MPNGYAIAIDGPAAAGKGTIAPRLAKKLNGFYLYTGAMYRCLALLVIRGNADLKNEEALSSLLVQTKIEVLEDQVILNGEDVTDRLKKEDVAIMSSKVAAIPRVRAYMVGLQQRIAKKFMDEGKIVVAEGRDTGTRILPNAKLKIFLTAEPKIRAERRLKQLQDVNESNLSFEKILTEVKVRDIRDMNRKTDPLVSDPGKFGYFVLDNSNLTEDETLDILTKKVRELK